MSGSKSDSEDSRESGFELNSGNSSFQDEVDTSMLLATSESASSDSVNVDWNHSQSDESEEDDFPYPSTANPSEVKDFYALFAFPPGKKHKDIGELSFGKWMIFRPFTEIDDTWHKVRREVESGELVELVLGTICTTMHYNPTMGGPGPCTTAVICVHTMRDNLERVGHSLIAIAQHDIKYKTEEASEKREYSWTGEKKSVCLKTLYWNNGSPSLNLLDKVCYGPRTFKDVWHLNHVTAPETTMLSSRVYGRWVIEESYINLTGLWYCLKELIEEGELGPVEMVCPPKMKKNDPNENPVFLVYTACENKERVGLTLAVIVEKDLTYELSRESYRRSHYEPVYNHRIVWDEDEPLYEMHLIKRRPLRVQHYHPQQQSLYRTRKY